MQIYLLYTALCHIKQAYIKSYTFMMNIYFILQFKYVAHIAVMYIYCIVGESRHLRTGPD